jgi:3-methyladenine DNA glycosylase AlkD
MPVERPDPTDPTAFVDHLTEALRAAADPDQATAMAAYLKDQFPCLGAKGQVRKEVAKPYLADLKGHPDAVIPVAHACWAQPWREVHHVGCDLLRRWQKVLRPEHVDDLKTLITTHSWWDTVDTLAAHPLGHLVKKNPELVPVMDRWLLDDDIWVARAAILHQLTYKGDTDEERLFRYVLARADHPTFWMRKAQGWVLRTYARVNPDAVRAFVAAHEDELSGLTRREAMKHL